jgi:bifunctional non-homologous end joining protein LigD
LHAWGSRAEKLALPDRMIFDLDPDEAVPWPRVVESAHQIRSFLEEIGLKSFAKTTGGKGLHIVVPLSRRNDWDEVKGFSKLVADLIEQADPRHFTANMSKGKRRGKIFIDYLRNGRGATAICNYSTRAKPQAPVSVPLSWDELTPSLHSDEFTIRNLPDRLKSLQRDPWAKIASIRQSLSKAVKSKLGFSGP